MLPVMMKVTVVKAARCEAVNVPADSGICWIMANVQPNLIHQVFWVV